jgi:cytochrome d ubiquinol oxidase subunit I
MVGIGFALLALSAWFAWLEWRRRVVPEDLWLLRAVGRAVRSLVALWSGWVVTEVGRQPWTVVGLLLTRDAVSRAGKDLTLPGGDAAALRRGRRGHHLGPRTPASSLGAPGEITEAGDAEVPHGPSKARDVDADVPSGGAG